MKHNISPVTKHHPRRRAQDVQHPPSNVAIFKSLTAQMNLFHGALNALGDGLIALDMQQSVVLWNQWMSTNTSYPTSEAIGRSFIDLFPDLKDSRVHGAIRGALQNNVATSISDLAGSESFFPAPQFDDFGSKKEAHYALKIIPFNAGYAPLHCLIHVSDVTAAMAREKHLRNKSLELERQSLTDGLTGIANRRYFDLHLDQELRRAKRLGEPLSLLILDVDFFKRYNDHFGHRYGDHVLTQIASVLAKSVQRSGDLAARIGGEEFAVVLTNAGKEGAIHIAEKIRLAIEKMTLVHPYACQENRVTVSAGIATCHSKAGMNAIALFDQADENLYMAKRFGRNKVFYGGALIEQSKQPEKISEFQE